MKKFPVHPELKNKGMKVIYKILLITAFSWGFFLPGESQETFFLKEFSSGFLRPVCIACSGDERLFIVEQPGIIRIAGPDGIVRQNPFLDITDRVNSSATEQGLLGIAFHPQYTANGYFYVNYTGMGDSTHISRFSVSSANPDSAMGSSEHRILTIYQPYANHNGGDLQFGPDGFLYIGMGDGGSEGDPQNRAQNPTELLGKMLRIDVDSGDPYAIPPSNPFYGSSSYKNEIWSLGLRNPWRFSFDRETHDLWIGDVGGAQFEEIDFQPASGTGGENWGWRCYEGNVPFDLTGCPGMSSLSFPVFVYPHSSSDPCDAVTGGFVYRGIQSPSMIGRYYFADYCTDRIWSLRDSLGIYVSNYAGTFPENNFSSFGEDSNGEIYLAGRSSGKIYQLADTLLNALARNLFQTKMIIAPNPSTGKFRIDLPFPVTGNITIVVRDLQGRKLLTVVSEKEDVQVDASCLASGIYIITCSAGGYSLFGKLVRI
jgi:glucose/arabinose dehydrogenase